mgnify:CR=1 FL=1
MSDKRFCIRTAENRLKDRSLDFDIAKSVPETTDTRNNLRTPESNTLAVFVDNKVDITMTTAIFWIRKSVEFIRKRTKSFDKMRVSSSTDGNFSGLCFPPDACNTSDIA